MPAQRCVSWDSKLLKASKHVFCDSLFLPWNTGKWLQLIEKLKQLLSWRENLQQWSKRRQLSNGDIFLKSDLERAKTSWGGGQGRWVGDGSATRGWSHTCQHYIVNWKHDLTNTLVPCLLTHDVWRRCKTITAVALRSSSFLSLARLSQNQPFKKDTVYPACPQPWGETMKTI